MNRYVNYEDPGEGNTSWAEAPSHGRRTFIAPGKFMVYPGPFGKAIGDSLWRVLCSEIRVDGLGGAPVIKYGFKGKPPCTTVQVELVFNVQLPSTTYPLFLPMYTA